MPSSGSILRREILSQPEVTERIIKRESAKVATVAKRIIERDTRVFVLVGRGSADNAGFYGKYLFGAFNDRVVSLATPSLVTQYKSGPDMKDAVVIALSQSGASRDVVEVVELAREQGALTVAVTNTRGSDLANASEEVLFCHANKERSVAATKTYTAQLLLMALLSAHLSGDSKRIEAIARVPEAIDDALAVQTRTARVAERLRYLEHCAVVGRGFCWGTSFELALKLKELTYIIAQPYSSADFRHGPIAVVDPGFCVLLIAPSGKVLPDMRALIKQLGERQAETIVISDVPSVLKSATIGLPLPRGVPEWLSPLTAVVPGQLLALDLAKTKNLPIDSPRGLQKVTITR